MLLCECRQPNAALGLVYMTYGVLTMALFILSVVG